MVKRLIISIIIFLVRLHSVNAQHYDWSFDGLFDYYDKAQIQRGLQIYRQVCSNCHSLNYVSFNALSDLGYNQQQINYLQKQYNSNYFPAPFKTENEARFANNGSIPPDLSNIIKQRSKINFTNSSGADYITNLLLGYKDTNPNNNSSYYNPYFYNNDYINMPPPLFDNIVEYKDGTPQNTKQYAKDVSAFLYWCANPYLVEQHKMGFTVISFLIILLILLYKLKIEYSKELDRQKNKVNKVTQLILDNIRIISDYPCKGIHFQDITPLLNNGNIFKTIIIAMAEKLQNEKIDKIAAIEARGFILGAALALHLNVGFIPIRKQGKLPAETLKESYNLEYGSDIVEIHKDAVKKNENILLIDDLIASGGTANAAVNLLEKLNANIIGACFISNINFLGGAEQLKTRGIKVFSLIKTL